MATSDVDTEQLISRFCGALAPSDRAAFRAAAESALGTIVCTGEGVAYRTLREVWRGYFHPPPDPRIGAPRGVGNRPSKLMAGPPIGAEDVRAIARARNSFRTVG